MLYSQTMTAMFSRSLRLAPALLLLTLSNACSGGRLSSTAQRDANVPSDASLLNDGSTLDASVPPDAGPVGPCNGTDDDGDGKADEFANLKTATWKNAASTQLLRGYFHYVARDLIYGPSTSGPILKWNGTVWSTLTNATGLPTNGTLPMFVFLSENSIYAIGEDVGLVQRGVLQWTGAGWVPQTPGGHLNSLTFKNDTLYYGLGDNNPDGTSSTYKFTKASNTWSPATVPGANLKVVTISAANRDYKYNDVISDTEIYAVNADNDLISAFSVSGVGQWNVFAPGKTVKPYFKRISSTEIYAIGKDDSILYRWDGTSWKQLSPPLQNMVYFHVVQTECDGAIYAISSAALGDVVHVVD